MRILTWNLWWRHGPWRERVDAIAATRGRIRSTRFAGTAPVAGVWPSDHFAVVTELRQ